MSTRDNLLGAARLAAAVTLFNIGDTFAKLLAEQVPIFQVVALRNLAMVVVLVLVWVLRRDLFQPQFLLDRSVLLRAALNTGATLCYLWGVSVLPLAQAATLLMASPLVATLLAALVLRERVGRARSLAVVLGFLGVLLVARPGAAGWSAAAALPVLAALFLATSDIVTRRIGSRIGAPTIVFTNLTLAGLIAGLLALPDLQPVPAAGLPGLFAAALFILAGYIAYVLAFQRGEVSFVEPFQYAGLPAALFLGLFVWGHWPDGPALVGTGLIVVAGLIVLFADRRGIRRVAGDDDLVSEPRP